MQVEDLIELVEQCPHLYNRSLKSFKDDKMKQNSWKSIAEYLKSDAVTVRKRWENLRDRFVRAYRDYNNKLPSGSAGGSKKTVEFIYFQQMLWLGPFLRQQKLTSSIEATVTNNIKEVVENTAEEIVNADENPESEYQIFEVGSDEILSPTPSSSHSQQSTRTFRQEKAKVHEKMSKAIESFTQICDKKYNAVPQEKNEGDMNFMRSIVEDMQVLRPAKRLRFKREIMDLLIQYTDDDE